MHPIPVAALHPTAVADLTAMAMPADLTRKLADKLARATALDDEYVVVDFDLNNFEIGDEVISFCRSVAVVFAHLFFFFSRPQDG